MLRQALLVLLALAALPATGAPERNPLPARAGTDLPVERLIVKLRAAGAARAQAQAVATPAANASATALALDALGARAGVLLAHSHSITGEIHVARLFRAQAGDELGATLARLGADPAVAYVSADRRKQPHGVPPNDPLYSGTPGLAGQTGQWYLQAPQATPAGTTTAAIDAADAWGVTTGSAGVVIADLDTGVRFDHPDLQKASLGGKLLPGYDFVGCDGGVNCTAASAYRAANDGDGWDPDPSDPGDWIDANDLKLAVFSGCGPASDSSWHGTRTAGILGAHSNNGVGIAGVTWNAWLLPVRVLGKCGGYDSDIVAGMLWAAGIAVAGVPANPYPASVLNLSLGSANACSASYQDAIAQVVARGAVVVASAGNEGGPVDEPANCPGAIGVAGVRHAGTKVGYSSLGAEAALAAPAGNCVNTTAGSPCLFSIDTTTNLGTTVPGANAYTDQFNTNIGTSFSAPLVTGISALMLSVNGNLKPAQLLVRLRNGARAFPVIATDSSGNPIPTCQVPTGFKDTSQQIECNCTTATCGAGLADAARSINEALRPIAAIAVGGTIAAGAPVALSAAGSGAACGRSVAGYAWSIVGSPVGSPSLTALTGATTSLSAAPASGTVTVQLVVTDSQGLTDTATVAVGPSTASSAAPASAGANACPVPVLPPAPAVTISVSPSPITLGQSATLTWTASNATGCTASGAWSGSEQTSGTQTLTPSAAGALDYSLACSGAGGSSTAAATLTVNTAAAGQAGGGGGGAADVTTLALAALAGLGARRRRAGAGPAR